MYDDNDVNPLKLVTKLGLNRRQFFAATTGMAAAAALTIGAACAANAAPGAANGVLVPPGKSRHHPLHGPRRHLRATRSTCPYAVRLQGGLRGAVSIGYRRSSSPATARTPTPRVATTSTPSRVRSCCARGSTTTASRPRATTAPSRRPSPTPHSPPSTPPARSPTSSACSTSAPAATRRAAPTSPTGPPPPSGGTSYGSARRRHGLKLYTHNHDVAYSFLLDSGPPDALGRPTRSIGVRRLEYFLANTDPEYVYLEMDIYWAHVAQYKHTSYTAPDGSTVTSIFDPAAVVAAQPHALPALPREGRQLTDPARPTATSWCRSATGDIDY